MPDAAKWQPIETAPKDRDSGFSLDGVDVARDAYNIRYRKLMKRCQSRQAYAAKEAE